MARTRRVLIITSSYAPVMIADMHRARMLAWELPKIGWSVEILAPGENFQHATCIDVDSGAFFPQDVPVHQVEERAARLFGALGIRSIGWRAMNSLYDRGLCLLQTGLFDLVYFSTTQFILFLLGPAWQRSTGTPYVLDFHDPWYRPHVKYVTTRSKMKFALNNWLAQFLERIAVTRASGCVTVSEIYLRDLNRRYSAQRPRWLRRGCSTVAPFGALPRDLEEARRNVGPVRSRDPETIDIVYVGVGGPIMVRSFRVICRTLATLREQGNKHVQRVRIQLFGTTYGWREGGVKHLEEVAIEQGVRDLVRELPQRVSYRRSLELLLEADGALILGVDDEGYIPSKLFNYAASRKPLLASLHRASPAYAYFRCCPALGHALWFDCDQEMPLNESTREVMAFLKEAADGGSFDRRGVLEPFLAPAMARRHAELFEKCLAQTPDL